MIYNFTCFFFLHHLCKNSFSQSIDMMQRRFKQVLTAVKENCSVGYAKIVTAGGFSNVNLIVIKATSPTDSPLSEKYVQELLKIFAFSPTSCRTFSLSFSRRFRKTRCWRVGLKCLLLLHRLIQSAPQNSEFRLELLRSRANGFISLYQRHIREDEDYASFIRSYARLLNEALDSDLFYSTEVPGVSSEAEAMGTTSSRIKKINKVIEISTQMQSLIDRVIDCRPAGRAARSTAVRMAMKHIIRESFICYQSVCRDINSIEDGLLQLPHRSCAAAIRVYRKAAVQADRLAELYDWCKFVEVCSLYQFPDIERIPESRIQALISSFGIMWQLTESSSSFTSFTNTSESSSFNSPARDETEKKVAATRRNVVVGTPWAISHDSGFAVKP
ncbi:putative clathrin assembly protein At2g25430 [Cucurbita moschata]|uniref:Clathrin assembly protein At2g25430 n=1 Tax=Cucurbita moschata TaxID=3662 RepID=A0A6J1FDX7_CUCMO|nr:putative clathrin assembly protein At2g25430 [Cucurbita moschata]